MSTSTGFSLHDLVLSLQQGRELSADEIAVAVGALLDEACDPALKADFLRALTRKGETVDEIAAFVEPLLARALQPAIDPATLPGPMIDVCGTGGDRLDLFNVSTTSMFILAAGGAAVIKHGNRSISSRCGGADVLEELGVRIDFSPEALREQAARYGFGFVFAAHYHPAFKVLGPIRKTLAAEGCPTVFNLLGPLLNPARPTHQLVGIFSKAALPKYAAVLQKLGRKRAWAIHGRAGTDPDASGMDEVSTLGPTEVRVVTPESIEERQISLERLRELQISPATLADLRGGSKEENARILLGILDGSERGPRRELALLNAAAAFVVVGKAADLAGGFAYAAEQIDSGAALARLSALRQSS